MGAARPVPEIFREISWGASSVLSETLGAAARAGIEVELLPQWYDVDTPEDLGRLRREIALAPGAAHTRAFLSELTREERR